MAKATPEAPTYKSVTAKDTAQQDILLRTANGEDQTTICKAPGMPHRQTVHRWLLDDPHFCDLYARAKLEQADVYAEQVLDIARQTHADPDITHERVQAARTAIDALKWTAGRLRPSKWGDRVTVGGDSEAPVMIDVSASPRMALEQYLSARVGRASDVIDAEIVYPTSRTTQISETKTQPTDIVDETPSALASFVSRRGG